MGTPMPHSLPVEGNVKHEYDPWHPRDSEDAGCCLLASSIETGAFCLALQILEEEGTWAALEGLAVTFLLPSQTLPAEPLPGRDRQCQPGSVQSVNLMSLRGFCQTDEPPVGGARGLASFPLGRAFLLLTVTTQTAAPRR